jgi:Zn-dependent M28 family amino/carboxypeptidase
MKRKIIILVFVIVSSVLWGCKSSGEKIQPITHKEIEGHIRFLSDDLLEGRAVGSEGLALAALYQESVFIGLGLEPVFGQSYRQSFTLRGIQPDKNANLDIFSDAVIQSFEMGNEFVVTSHREDTPEGVEGELVYCGYLIQAPERNWDDVKSLNLKGKVLLVEINEPENNPGGIFDGEEMTYYGRWTYKFEKASELGATGIMIIHNTKGAAYGWRVVQNSFLGESFFLPDTEPTLFFQGWIHEKTTEKILKSAGFNRMELLAQAEKKDFVPLPLGLTVRVRQKPEFRSVSTENVAALLKGKHRKHKDRFIILSAHFDHLGRNADLEGDQIYNGAVDNCSASACLLSLARYYSQQPEKLKANLVFLAATAEEQGLKGSDYFARHLPFPKSSVLANLNFELTNVWGETEDVYAIGAKHSDLDDICQKAAQRLGFTYIPERLGHLGYFFRSDQLSFARAGIPAVWLHEGVTSRRKDKDYILKKNEEYRKYKYHKVSDEISEDWDLSGTVQLAQWACEIILLLSETDNLPRFRETSSFRR